MRKIEGVEYIDFGDLSELWGQERRTLAALAYRATGWKGSRRIPRPDIDQPRRKFWRYDRLDELNKWWSVVRGGEITTTHTDTAETHKEETPVGYKQEIHKTPEHAVITDAATVVKPQILFTGADITITLTTDHEFPAFRENHVLCVVTRYNAGKSEPEKYFITRDQAETFLALFNA